MLKNYVDGNLGLPVFRGPYLQQDAHMAAFLFSADHDRLTQLCYQYLVAPSDGETIYVPLLPHVLVVFADMHVSSLNSRDQKVGRIPETEISFWILTVAMRKVGPVLVPHHLAWFIPYLFVNEGNAIATGREVFGFNKQMAQFQKPDNIQAPELSVGVLGFEQFNPESKAKMEPLLEISRLGPVDNQHSRPEWDNWESAKAEIDQELLKNIEAAPKNKVVEIGARLVNAAIPLVFLKQFRHVSNTEQACYQAIVEAPMKVKKFHRGGFLSNQYQMSINHLDSHPLVDRLGLRLENGKLRAKVGLWMKVDFVLGAGTEIWKAE